jgi:hypothetical protein
MKVGDQKHVKLAFSSNQSRSKAQLHINFHQNLKPTQ